MMPLDPNQPESHFFVNLNKKKLKIKVGRFLYDKCAQALKDSGEFFMTNLTAADVYQLKKRLRKRLDQTVTVYPADYEEDGTTYEGHLFKVEKSLAKSI